MASKKIVKKLNKNKLANLGKKLLYLYRLI